MTCNILEARILVGVDVRTDTNHRARTSNQTASRGSTGTRRQVLEKICRKKTTEKNLSTTNARNDLSQQLTFARGVPILFSELTNA